VYRIKNQLRSAPLYIYRWSWSILPEPKDPNPSMFQQNPMQCSNRTQYNVATEPNEVKQPSLNPPTIFNSVPHVAVSSQKGLACPTLNAFRNTSRPRS